MSDALRRARQYCEAIIPEKMWDGPSTRTEINEVKRCLSAIIDHLESLPHSESVDVIGGYMHVQD